MERGKGASSTNQVQKAASDREANQREETAEKSYGSKPLRQRGKVSDIKSRPATLRRAESLRKLCRKKEHKNLCYKDPFKFLKVFFTKEKSRTLKASKQELEQGPPQHEKA